MKAAAEPRVGARAPVSGAALRGDSADSIAAQAPTDVVAGITLACLGIPEVMGYTTIAGMPVITGLYTILDPDRRLRAARVVAAPGGRCRLGDGGDLAAGLAGMAASGVARVRRAGRDAGPGHRWVPDPGPAASGSGFIANFLSRTRAGRLPHRRRHPGRDGPGRRHVRHPRAVRRHGRRSSSRTLEHLGETQRRRPWRLGGRARGDPRVEGDLAAHPGAADRRGRRDRRQLAAGPRRRRCRDARRGARRPAALRLPHRSPGPVRRAARHRRARSSSSCSPRAPPPRAPTPRSTRSRSTRTSTSSGSAGERRRRALAARSSSTAAPPRPRWSTAPVARARSPSLTTGRDRADRAAVPHQAAAVHARRPCSPRSCS